MGLTLDTEAMGLWPGGPLFVDFLQISGRSITDHHVGDLQFVNNSDAPPGRTQVSEYWYEQRLFEDVLRIKLGKMDANNDFAYVDYGGEFINSSPGFPPIIPFPT
jgi:carbohydrate-selective porin OprB